MMTSVLYALNRENERVRAQKGHRARCPNCDAELLAKCGKIKVHHWSHEAGDCDPWSEPEGEWHLAWKLRADQSWCEVTMGPHRADIRLPNRRVIELQHSSISVDEIAEREDFYGDMLWLFDAGPFLKRLTLGIREDGSLHVDWPHARQSIATATKPVCFDLGGPILEVEQFWLRGRYLRARIVPLAEFLARHGLRALSGEEAKRVSHYSIRHQYSDHRDVFGSVELKDEPQWRQFVEDAEVKIHRLDGSFEVISD